MYTIDKARQIFPDTQTADAVPAITARFKLLSAEDQLALIWFAYLEMGQTITVAAPGAARMALARPTLDEILEMSFDEQTKVMCDLASKINSPIATRYAFWSINVKLGFWYELGELMRASKVAPIPPGYKLSANASSVLEAVKKVEQGQQISLLRNFVADMGFDPDVTDDQIQAEPIIAPTPNDKREKIFIPGILNQTIISYMELLNSNDFDQLINLFLDDGALQPPFQRPIVGREAILKFFRRDCQNLKLMPQGGFSEPADSGFNQIKVTGKVQTPWFGQEVGMNVAWRFLLDENDKIYFVAIDLLASPAELLKLGGK
ncbi:orange carotenoid protein N-terminal domain-containing protein [Synechococcus sp. M16CYN]|uniref:orange carotenoid protein N-terminal domain-containing protein n=1 Tax=Synechococcus sp. M16CYN TaxID=3103139 RepID=UPI0033426FB0